MTDPNPFQADDKREDLTRNLTTFLDLSNAPVGTYYFNKENNSTYTQNWFNYSKFHIVPEHSIVSEVVQYGRPNLIAGSLDTSRMYTLPATVLTADWAARVLTGQNVALDSPGFSGFDAQQNTYVLTNYTTNVSCNSFNADNTVAFTKAGNGITSGCAVLTKYFSTGFVAWAARIRTASLNQVTQSLACTTDQNGTTYILGIGTGIVAFEDALGSVILSVDVTNRTYLVAYNTSGIPLWVTYFSGQHRGTLTVDNQPIGHVLVYFENESDTAVDFYDNVLISPSVVLTAPASSNVVLAKFATSNGLFVWASYISGFRVGLFRNMLGFVNQSVACDASGNIVCTGAYAQLNTLTNAASPVQPTFSSTSIDIPPYSSPVVWVPREADRNWSAVDVEGTGQFMLAAVDNGLLYISSDYGENWVARATPQRWSSVFCGTVGTLMAATIEDSIIFRSIDAGQSWAPAALEGSTSRKWNALAGNAAGSILVASAKNDYLFRSFDYGASWYISQNLLFDGVLTLGAGENLLRTAFIDNNDQFLYWSTYTSPGKVIKVNGTTAGNPSWVSTLTLPVGENLLSSLAYDSVQGMSFYGTDTTPGKIIQTDLVPARIAGITLMSIEAQVFRSGVINAVGSFVYLGSESLAAPYSGRSQVVRVNFSNPSGAPVVDRVLMTNVGDQSLECAVISPSGQYVYFGNNFREIITFDVTAWTRIGSTSLLLTDGSDLRCVVSSASGQYAYFGTRSPPNVVRVDVSTLPNPTRIGTAALPSGEEPQSAAMVPSGTFAYFGTDTSPAKIVKIDVSTFPNPTRVGALTLATGQNKCNFLVIDAAGAFAYAGLYTTPGQIVKINLTTFTVASTHVLTGYNPVVSGVLDGTILYVMTTGETLKFNITTMSILASVLPGATSDAARVALLNSVTSRAYFLQNTQERFYPINLTSFGILPYMDLRNYRENQLQCAIKDPNSNFAYFGTYETYSGSSAGGRIIKVQTNPALTYYGSFALENEAVYQLSCAVVDSIGKYAYFGTDTAPASIVKLDITSNPYPTELSTLTLDLGEDFLKCCVIDPQNKFAYFGTNTTPGNVIKVNLTSFTRVESLALNVGDNALTSALMDPLGNFAYFGTNTSPGRIVVIALGSFNWVNTITLPAGQSLLTAATLSSDGNRLFFGSDTSPGKVIRMERSITSPVENWIDVAYDGTLGVFVALIPNQLAYCSFDEGLTWNSIPTTPLLNWSAIAGARINAIRPYAFYATVSNGPVYGLNYSGGVWSWNVLLATNRAYTDIATSGGPKSLTFGTVEEGSIYQSIGQNNNVWIPTTIPRNWDAVAVTSSLETLYAVAAVRGGQLYVATDPYPYLHTFILRYTSDGIVQWANYVNCRIGAEGDNVGVAVACKPNGEIIVSGLYEETVDFYSASDYSTVVKSLDVHTPDSVFLAANPQLTNNYIACYSADGLPVWVNSALLSLDTVSGQQAFFTSLAVDTKNHVYVFGYSRSMLLFQPDGRSLGALNDGTAVLLQLYPNGYIQSYTRLANELAPNNFNLKYAFGVNVHVSADGSAVYLTGLNNGEDADLYVYNSLGTLLGLAEPFTEVGSFIVKYATAASPLTNLPAPEWNNPFQPQLNIGGGNRTLIGGYVADTRIETWGGKTGFNPSAISLDDANAAVISYTGHEPGYAIPLLDGYPTTTDANVRHLAVQVQEPSFPANDPQPVTPASVPYGYLPIFLSFPAYTTSVTFNAQLNDATRARCTANGTVSSSGWVIAGVQIGDTLRFLLNTPTTSRYVTLHVDDIIPSDVASNTPAQLIFAEPTRYLSNALGGPTTAAQAILVTIGNAQYVPAFWLPSIVDEGTLHLIVQLYPQIHR